MWMRLLVVVVGFSVSGGALVVPGFPFVEAFVEPEWGFAAAFDGDVGVRGGAGVCGVVVPVLEECGDVVGDVVEVAGDFGGGAVCGFCGQCCSLVGMGVELGYRV